MPRAKRNRRSKANGNGNGNTSRGPSRWPKTTLKRTFRHTEAITLNNTQGTETYNYNFFSKYIRPEPEKCLGFKDTQQTFEFWRINKFRIRAQPGYNDYNQSYNTINLDALAAMQIWTAADPSLNEAVSGGSIQSYNNAKVHTLSLNGIKTIVNTQCRVNQTKTTPKTILPSQTWLDTSQDMVDQQYSGAQVYMTMVGQNTTNYRPVVQLIFEYDVEFKQPGYQNRPSTFETSIIGGVLSTVPDGSEPTVFRDYKVVSFTLDGGDNNYRLERVDGVAGSLDYTQEEFWEVYFYGNSGKYFSAREVFWNGVIPRKPLGWQPSTD